MYFVRGSRSELTVIGAGTNKSSTRSVRLDELTLEQVYCSSTRLPLCRLNALCLQRRSRHQNALERRNRMSNLKWSHKSFEADGVRPIRTFHRSIESYVEEFSGSHMAVIRVWPVWMEKQS